LYEIGSGQKKRPGWLCPVFLIANADCYFGVVACGVFVTSGGATPVSFCVFGPFGAMSVLLGVVLVVGLGAGFVVGVTSGTVAFVAAELST